jgi:Kef-type K+ transport system membrane component KefB
MFIIVFVSAWFTEIIGIDAIFGAFVTGIITPREHRFAINIIECCYFYFSSFYFALFYFNVTLHFILILLCFILY